jgi:hypothetical protein
LFDNGAKLLSEAAKKKREQRQRKRSGGIMLPHMFVMNKVALTEALIFDDLLDEEDGEDRDAIAKAVEDLLWFYVNEEKPIAVGRPKNYRTGLLDRQGFDVGDTWELIKKELKRESESEDYLVVLSVSEAVSDRPFGWDGRSAPP